ncbi:DUF1254 domain-containing protein [Streptomyces sp. NPDC058486]|uniref:DUF1254 domain-containing protein n=1 Tax=unclassified Streptomyces TaxID=2593676 RepID=UPI003655CE21
MSGFQASLVRSAFIYSLPLAEIYRQTSLSQLTESRLNRLMPYRDLLDATYRKVPSPNNDTLYTAFGFDLSEGPLVVQAPPIPPDRYFVLPFYDAFTNVFASYGTRMGTTDGVNLLLTPPGYDGPVPPGLTELRSPSFIGVMLGRILVQGPEDLDAVHTIQDRFVVEPLDGWLKGVRTPALDVKHPQPVPGFTFFDTRNNPEGFWQGVGEIIVGTPVPDTDRELFDTFAPLGLTQEGFTFPEDPDERALLLQETEASWKFIADFTADQSAAEAHGVKFFNSNGWGWPSAVRDPQNVGRTSYGENYLVRAWVNYLYYGMLPSDEALYPAVYTDADGARLHGDHTYTLTLPATGRPVRENGFTSVTLYGDDGYFVPNPQNTYKIGDRDRDLVTDADGNTVITISAERPTHATNWLPAPRGGLFYLMYRAYLPVDTVLDGTHTFPGVHKVR